MPIEYVIAILLIALASFFSFWAGKKLRDYPLIKGRLTRRRGTLKSYGDYEVLTFEDGSRWEVERNAECGKVTSIHAAHPDLCKELDALSLLHQHADSVELIMGGEQARDLRDRIRKLNPGADWNKQRS